MLGQLCTHALAGQMACFVIVQTEQDGIELRHPFQHFQYRLNGCAAAGYIAVLLPVLWMECDIGQHINGSLKHIEALICADMVKAVPGIAALHIQPECFPVAVGTPFVCMTGYALLIYTNKYGIVVISIFVQELLSGEVRNHAPVDATVLDQIGIDPAHILIGRWQYERLGRLLHPLSGRGIDRSHLTAQEHGHRIGKAEAIELLDKADGMTAALLGVIVPLVAADGNAVVAGQPLLSAGGDQFLSTTTEELLQVHCGCTLFLFFCEMNIA